MNPIQWLKAIYEVFGSPYPRVSLVVVAILGALGASALWVFAAKQVEKDHAAAAKSASPPTSAPTSISGPASTTGPNSPAVTGDGNNINIGNAQQKSKP